MDDEDAGAEETEVGHKLTADQPYAPIQRQRYVSNYYSVFQGDVLF